MLRIHPRIPSIKRLPRFEELANPVVLKAKPLRRQHFGEAVGCGNGLTVDNRIPDDDERETARTEDATPFSCGRSA
jgi:hypothetical protein